MEAASPSDKWELFRQILRNSVTPITWQTWLSDLQLENISGKSIHLTVPTEFHLRWINDKHRAVIEEAIQAVFGPDGLLVMQARPAPDYSVTDIDDEIDELPTSPAEPESEPEIPGHIPPKYSFENFVVGPSNRFAHAAAMAIAERPGHPYNPLFIYAGAGLGKTHLLQAIALHTHDLHPRLDVCYINSEHFVNDFIDCIRRKRMDEFKARYRSVDMLLLDDVQFLEGKEQILEEFFHTFNALYESGRQLVFSSDRPPRGLSNLEDRIRSRFEWGLTTDIQPPDVETRLAILRKNAAFAPQQVPQEVLQFIADRVVLNIRELEGALTRVTAYAALTHQVIDLDIATDVLQDIVPAHSVAPIAPGRILGATASAFDTTITDLEGPSRRQPLARARQVGMYLCRELTDLSLPKIGSLFGNRDHTTVMHGIKTVKELMQTDQGLFDQVTALLQSLRVKV